MWAATAGAAFVELLYQWGELADKVVLFRAERQTCPPPSPSSRRTSPALRPVPRAMSRR
ncbi:hypothetical protein HD597_000041 [Nonomuraea thailandensis]|uniref:Uncharacterized protein n=1 Tax=Nonomuraea thailandensis TaxID=1188745 RepID=A0A9X2K101_9ACTN|nr:hypothetical protein [Nonomuraea thailandensis]MCP2353021.1 hypothetical protein [Nonomuraea thailandensis]